MQLGWHPPPIVNMARIRLHPQSPTIHYPPPTAIHPLSIHADKRHFIKIEIAQRTFGFYFRLNINHFVLFSQCGNLYIAGKGRAGSE